MTKQAAFVDCVSVPCPSVLTMTLKRLAKVERGSRIEVICNNRYEASQVKEGCERAGHKVVGMSQDATGITHVLVLKVR